MLKRIQELLYHETPACGDDSKVSHNEPFKDIIVNSNLSAAFGSVHIL